jgi:exo-beta-1,3-glucanase (GH17 family)
LISTLDRNRFAKFVVRAVQFGSEPLFDDVLSPNELAEQVREAKEKLKHLHISVTVSDLAYSYQKVRVYAPILRPVAPLIHVGEMGVF